MTKMFKTALFAATAAATLAATPVLAESVLVVDFGQVFADSTAGKNGTQQLAGKYQATLTARQNAFNTAAQAYNSQIESARRTLKPNTPVPAATQQAVQQAGERAQQAQDQLNQVREETNQAAAYIRSQIVEHVTPIAEQIRAERKADVVIPKDGVLASNPAVDITATVIQRLNASFTTPSITPPQQAAPATPAATGARPQGR